MPKLSIRVRTTPTNLTAVISNAPRLARGEMTYQGAKALVGTKRKGLKHYPPYKHIRRKKAFGKTFKSPEQQRWFFWALKANKIKPGTDNRTGDLSDAWKAIRKGAKSTIINDQDYATFAHGRPGKGHIGQSRLMRLGGWKTVDQKIKANEKAMVQAAERALKKYLLSKGL